MMGGSVPAMGCPVEAGDDHNIAMPFKSIVSQMGKTRLSGFVTATAVVGYVMSGGTSLVAVTALTTGTMLQAMSANTTNQIIEVDYDKMMKRTCKRPLPTGQITKGRAALLSASELAVGSSILYAVSPLAAAVGLANWFIYVGVYTPLKRVSAVNTWFGSIVGGLPPLMGGVCASGVLVGAGMSQSYLLASFLLVWQIPHFMALSFHCRRDYEFAGYKMLAFYNPWRASFYAILMSIIMALLTLAGPMCIEMEVEGLWYYPVATVANGLMIFKSIKFHTDPVKFCRGCFVFSYMYLGVMLLAFSVNQLGPVKQARRLLSADAFRRESV